MSISYQETGHGFNVSVDRPQDSAGINSPTPKLCVGIVLTWYRVLCDCPSPLHISFLLEESLLTANSTVDLMPATQSSHVISLILMLVVGMTFGESLTLWGRQRIQYGYRTRHGPARPCMEFVISHFSVIVIMDCKRHDIGFSASRLCRRK